MAGAQPGAVLGLHFEEDAFNILLGDLGVFAAALVHALGVVVGAVEEHFLVFGRFIIQEPVGRAMDKGGLVLAADLHGKEAGCAHGEFGVAPGLVGKAGFLVDRVALGIQFGLVGTLQVLDCILNGGGRDFEPRIFGGT